MMMVLEKGLLKAFYKSYSCLAKSDLNKVINDLQRKVNPSCVGFDETKAELRNLVASMNVDSGAWLKAGYFSISK